MKLLLLLTILITAAAAGYGKAPEQYESVDGDPYNTRIYTLANGLKVYLCRNTREPRIQTYIAVRAGSADESAQSTGLAHYFEHMMFKGNSRIASLDWAKEKPLLDRIAELFEERRNTGDPQKREELYREIDRLSGEAAKYSNNEFWNLQSAIGAQGTNAWTSFDETVYTNDIPAHQLERFLCLESIRFSEIALRRFHTELETVYEEFNRKQDRDGSVIYQKLMAAAFPHHPYGRDIIGLPEHLKSPSMKDIHTFFEEYYTADNMALILAGDLEFDRAIELADRYFGQLKPGKIRQHQSGRGTEEAPLKGETKIEFSGPEQEKVVIAYRFKSNPRTELMLQLIDQLLNNGTSGLLETDLEQTQKVQDSSFFVLTLRDYALAILNGDPRQGQSLEEVRTLLLAELDKIKRGEFEDWMPKAIADNLRYQTLADAEKRDTAAMAMVDAFTRERSLRDILTRYDRMEKVTRAEIMEFAQEHFGGDRITVFKTTGKRDKVVAEKPKITPVAVPDTPSAFAKQFYQAKPSAAASAAPVLVDFQKDMHRQKIQEGMTLYSIENKANERFTLQYYFPAGQRSDPLLPLAFEYANLLGTDRYAPGKLKQEFYRYALRFHISAGERDAVIQINGLQRNFQKGVELAEHVIRHLQPDANAYRKFVESILKDRENEQKSPEATRDALMKRAIYGPVNPVTDRLSENQLKQIRPETLTEMMNGIFRYGHDLFYYGPEKAESIGEQLQKLHMIPDHLMKFAPEKQYVQIQAEQDTVYLADYPGAQVQAMFLRVGDTGFSLDKLGFATFAYPYAARSIFREIREKQGLAYSAYFAYQLPDDLREKTLAVWYAGTQPDKLKQTLSALRKFMEQVPAAETQFFAAKEMILQGLRSDRVQAEDIYALFRRAKKRGLDHDWRKEIYEQSQDMTLQKFNADYTKYLAGRPATLILLGDRSKLDFEALKPYGKIQEFKTEELFRIPEKAQSGTATGR